MEGAPPQFPGRPPPPPPQRDSLPRDDLRGLRRWVLVAGVWAVAATAIALIALLDTSDEDAQKEADDASGRITRMERKLDARLDALDKRLENVPQSTDVSNLQERLSNAEADATKAAKGVKDAQSSDDQVKDLEERVQALEDTAEAGSGGEDTGSATP